MPGRGTTALFRVKRVNAGKLAAQSAAQTGPQSGARKLAARKTGLAAMRSDAAPNSGNAVPKRVARSGVRRLSFRGMRPNCVRGHRPHEQRVPFIEKGSDKPLTLLSQKHLRFFIVVAAHCLPRIR